jgi:hypothetical protein
MAGSSCDPAAGQPYRTIAKLAEAIASDAAPIAEVVSSRALPALGARAEAGLEA